MCKEGRSICGGLLRGRGLREAHRAAHGTPAGGLKEARRQGGREAERQGGREEPMVGLTGEQAREFIARRVAQELRDGYYVNLGIGLPPLVVHYIPAGMGVILPSETGLLR